MRKQTSRAGFTLIELIIVLLVMASLAALVVPTLGFVKDQSDTALSANGAQGVLNNLEQYKVAFGNYPDGFDTLVDESGAFHSRVFNIGGTVPYGTVAPGGGAGFAHYWMSMGAGMRQVAVHDSTNTGLDSDPNVPGVLVPLDGSINLMVMEPGHVPATPSFSPKEGLIIAACFPTQADPAVPVVPAGHTLVFLGVGATNTAVGNTMTSAPLAPEKSGSDTSQYDRFIAVFDVSPGGATNRGRADLKLVLDPEFNVVARNVDFYQGTREDGTGR